jgi:diaminopimelate epimerase
MSSMIFEKYHALGNDYLVYDPRSTNYEFSETEIIRICHRNFGLGSDGILVGPLPSESADFRLRILNPDGSEAEKSGNGLRIFARYLRDINLVNNQSFTVDTLGGIVTCEVSSDKKLISVEMGQVSFHSDSIPVYLEGDPREVLNENITLSDTSFSFFGATIGNPHCVVPVDEVDENTIRKYGPELENHPNFPNRTNVQFLQVLDRNRIKIEIWERGAGYTLASGSSSSAAGAVARKIGACDSQITVEMPGGEIELEIDDHFNVLMKGPATRVAQMILDLECINDS